MESDAVRNSCRPRMLFGTSFRNPKGFFNARCDKGTLLSFKLRSLRGRLILLLCRPLDGLRILGSGRRFDVLRSFHDSEEGLLCFKDGRERSGEPADRGCEIQSSDKESSQAFSIALQFVACAENAI